MSWHVGFEWQPRDLWLGVYVEKPRWAAVYISNAGGRPICHSRYVRSIYICIVPCLPLVVTHRWVRT